MWRRRVGVSARRRVGAWRAACGARRVARRVWWLTGVSAVAKPREEGYGYCPLSLLGVEGERGGSEA
jgi:hypothetical protein